MADKGIGRIVQLQKRALKEKSFLFMAYGYKEGVKP
jgi:hypothetical protein